MGYTQQKWVFIQDENKELFSIYGSLVLFLECNAFFIQLCVFTSTLSLAIGNLTSRTFTFRDSNSQVSKIADLQAQNASLCGMFPACGAPIFIALVS